MENFKRSHDLLDHSSTSTINNLLYNTSNMFCSSLYLQCHINNLISERIYIIIKIFFKRIRECNKILKSLRNITNYTLSTLVWFYNILSIFFLSCFQCCWSFSTYHTNTSTIFLKLLFRCFICILINNTIFYII